jgi:hypothetical protein
LRLLGNVCGKQHARIGIELASQQEHSIVVGEELDDHEVIHGMLGNESVEELEAQVSVRANPPVSHDGFQLRIGEDSVPVFPQLGRDEPAAGESGLRGRELGRPMTLVGHKNQEG